MPHRALTGYIPKETAVVLPAIAFPAYVSLADKFVGQSIASSDDVTEQHYVDSGPNSCPLKPGVSPLNGNIHHHRAAVNQFVFCFCRSREDCD